MPTQHPRIAVTKDDALADALASVEPFFSKQPTATVVHDLAVRGAAAVLDQERARGNAFRRLIALSTERSEELDWAVLETIDDHAWGE